MLLLLRVYGELGELPRTSGNSSAWLNSGNSDCGYFGFFGDWDYAYGNFGSCDVGDFRAALRTWT